MKKSVKGFIALVLAVIMVFGTAPLESLTGIDFGNLFRIETSASAAATVANPIFPIQLKDENDIVLVDPSLMEVNTYGGLVAFNGEDYKSGGHYGCEYRAIDMLGGGIIKDSTTVHAIETGHVVFKDSNDGVIIIEHNNTLVIGGKYKYPKWYSLYAHMSNISVSVSNDDIKKGTAIGKVSNKKANGSVGTHLHFAVTAKMHYNKYSVNSYNSYWIGKDSVKRTDIQKIALVKDLCKYTISPKWLGGEYLKLDIGCIGEGDVADKAAIARHIWNDAAPPLGYYRDVTFSSLNYNNVSSTNVTISAKMNNPDLIAINKISVYLSKSNTFNSPFIYCFLDSSKSVSKTISCTASSNFKKALSSGTKYYFKFVAETEYGSMSSSTKNFTTVKSKPPKTKWRWLKKIIGYIGFSKSNAAIQSDAPIVDCPDVSIGSSVLLTWEATEFADYYTVSVNGVEQPERITDTQHVLLLDTAGVKELRIRAHNDAGSGEWSDPAVVTVHDDVTVTFTVNGNTYQQTAIPWGTTFYNYPAYPEKEGYTFTGWFKQGTTAAANFEELKSDLTVYAGFRVNTYAVTFLDRNGNVVKTQTVNFGEAAAAPDPSEFMEAGYVFLGWNKPFNCIKSDLTVKAVARWENENLPITLSAVSCTRGQNGYTTYYTVNNNVNKFTYGRIVIALKTQEGKLITTTESNAFSLGANSSKTDDIFIPDIDEETKTGIGASVAEVYAVKRYQTTVPISPAVTVSNITDENPWSNWSEDIPPAGAETETRTIYRSRDKHLFTTNNVLPVDGINFLYNTRPPVTSYGSWSAWSDTAITGNSSREVQTETRYKFYHYCTGNTGSAYSSYWVHYDPACMRTASFDYHETGWMTSIPASWTNTGVYEAEDVNHLHPNYIQYDSAGNKIRCSNTCYTYYLATKTVYSYRPIYITYTYDYYNWNPWSDWSDTVVTPTSNRQVETKTLYRYKMFDLEERIEDTSGVQRTLSSLDDPELEKFPQYAGKQATLFIYKYNETSDWTTEYVGQTVIAADGSYSFAYKLREEPSELTGDYTITLGIEGATSSFYLKTIYAPVPEYQVTFADYDGTILSTQTIQKGGSAVVPDSPQREGYTFTGWDACSVNIQSDITVTAQYEINTYTVVFIDWLNHTYSLQTVEHGALLTPPVINSVPGRNILGWDKALEGVSTVTSNMVVCASFETQTFTVDFYDFSGNLVDSQVVEYGDYADAPVLDEGEDYVFLNWQSPDILEPELDVENEPIMKSISVKPNYVFTETVDYPTASVATGEYDTAQIVELTCVTEGAVIYYTLDGSDPAEPLNPAATEYTLPFTVSESVNLRFYACALGMNDSYQASEYYAINTQGNSIYHILCITGCDTMIKLIQDGSTIDNSMLPAVTGYDYEGLYRDQEFTLPWNMQTDTVTASMTLYAKYSAESYIVTFKDSDGTILDIQSVEYGCAASAPEITPPEGYVFTGWDTEAYTCVEGDLTVTARYVPASEYARISLDRSQYTMMAGTSFALTATITPAELTGKAIYWYSSDETVATVDENGLVATVSAGSAVITAVVAENGEFAACVVTVTANPGNTICLVAGSPLSVDSSGYLRGVKVTSNTVAELKTKFANAGLVFVGISGAILTDTDIAGTETVIRLMNGTEVLDEITVVVTGDMTGDGLINNRDAAMATRYLVGKENPTACRIAAIDVNADGFVNNRDAVMISRYLVGKETI